jgi:hypothetical protein
MNVESSGANIETVFESDLPVVAVAGSLLVGVTVLYAIAAGRKLAARKRRSAISLSWPLADATIEKSSIQRNDGPEGRVSWTVTVNFSYCPPPELRWLAGIYAEELGSKAEAETQLLSLRERRLYVRYNPSEPSQYLMDPYRDVFKDDHGSPDKILKY